MTYRVYHTNFIHSVSSRIKRQIEGKEHQKVTKVHNLILCLKLSPKSYSHASRELRADAQILDKFGHTFYLSTPKSGYDLVGQNFELPRQASDSKS